VAYLSLVPETLDNKRRFLPTGILDWTSDVCLSGREIYAGGEFRLMPFIVGQVDERGLPRGKRIRGVRTNFLSAGANNGPNKLAFALSWVKRET